MITQNQFEQLLDELRSRIKDDLKSELHKLDGKLDWIIGKYQSHDQEHTLLNGKVSDHSDRIEVIEEKLGITL